MHAGRAARPEPADACRAGVVGGIAFAGALSMLLIALSGCTGDGRELPEARVPLPPATITPTAPGTTDAPSRDDVVGVDLPLVTVASADTTPDSSSAQTPAPRVVIDELWSPEPAIALASGHGAMFGDPVTVDGRAADIVSFDIGPGDGFDVRVFIEDEGAHTVCVGDGCGRVYTLAPDAETPEEVVATINEAIDVARSLAPFDEWFPGWTIQIGGMLSGTGGSIDPVAKTVVVYRNRGRTVDDFVRTIFHEYGHVADEEWLDDDARRAFAALRGYPADAAWLVEGDRRLDDWAASPSEDLAEAMAARWSGERWPIRTDGGPLTDEQGRFLDDLIAAHLP